MTSPVRPPIDSPDSDHAAVIDVRGLRRRYGRGAEGYEAVRGVDLRVEQGEVFALLGTNGAGKTSTVELIEGLAQPSAGHVRVLGLDPYGDRLALRPRIGIMLQRAGFPGSLTVQEMADLWHASLPDPRPVGEVLELVVLSQRARVPIASLSGGEQRRLDLALALMGRPRVLFLDEPTTGLDPQSRRTTWDLITSLVADGVTVLLTTHLLEEAEELADRIAIMHEGVIADAGTLADLVARQPAKISFRLPDPDHAAALSQLVGAGFSTHPSRRDASAAVVEVITFEPEPLLRQLLSWSENRTELADLRVQPGSLERAFLDIAARPADHTAPHPENDPHLEVAA